MNQGNHLPGNFKILTLIALAGIILTLYLNLGKQPLYMEEPRRALIALEMLESQEYIVPTEFGNLYKKKPPLFNWMILCSYKVFGTINEFSTRFITPLSLLLMGFIIYLAGSFFFNRNYGILSALFFVISVDIFLYFSSLGEIDIFYSLLVFLSLISIPFFYQKKNIFLLFTFVYFFGGLAFLTKGMPTLVFLAISIPAFFIIHKKIKILISWQHFMGLLVFCLIVGSYFLAYAQKHDLLPYLKEIWGDAEERTIAHNSTGDFLKHFLLFPLNFLINLLPGSLFIPFLFTKNFYKKIKSNPLLLYAFWILVLNFLVYWISPGARSRYTYMLYPFAIYIIMFFYLEYFHAFIKRKKIIDGLILFSITVTLVGSVLIHMVKPLEILPKLWIVSAILILGLLFCYLLYQRGKYYRIFALIFVLIFIRTGIDLTIFPLRAKESKAKNEMVESSKIVSITGKEPIYLYKYNSISHRTAFYIGKETGIPIERRFDKHSNYFYLCNSKHINSDSVNVMYSFVYENTGQQIVLFKFH